MARSDAQLSPLRIATYSVVAVGIVLVLAAAVLVGHRVAEGGQALSTLTEGARQYSDTVRPVASPATREPSASPTQAESPTPSPTEAPLAAPSPPYAPPEPAPACPVGRVTVVLSSVRSEVIAVDGLFPDDRNFDRNRTTWTVTAYNNVDHAVTMNLSAWLRSSDPSAMPILPLSFNGAYLPPGGSKTVTRTQDYIGSLVSDFSWSIERVSGESYFEPRVSGCPAGLTYVN